MRRLFSADEIEKQAKDIYDDTDELKSLVEEFLNQDSIIGSPSGFHNLAISCSKNDDDENACIILEKGLELYPNNVDLLADYIQYGVNCNRNEECSYYFSKLKSIPKSKWTWRGFSFSIDYLIRCADDIIEENELIEYKKNMLSLADKYIEIFPKNEDAYISKSEIFSYFNDTNEEINILLYAIKNIRPCVKTALRYADMLFEAGDYKKAMEIIDRHIISLQTSQLKVSLSYVYYLSGLCKISLLEGEYSNKNGEIDDIYKDFYIARENGIGNTYNLVMEKQIRILEIKSGKKYEEIVADL